MLSSSASGVFSFSQTGPADLAGSSWDTTVEGSQNFPEFDSTEYYTGDAEDFVLPFGQATPKLEQSEPVDDFHARWTSAAAVENKALKAEPMRRGTSRSSTGSRKTKSAKASSAPSAKKSRTGVQSVPSQASSQLSKLDIADNASSAYHDGVQQYLDTLSLSPQVDGAAFYPGIMGLPDGLPFSTGLGAAMAQHVNPQIFDAGLIAASPNSWGSLSPVDSRLSSPGVPDGLDDVWSAVPSTSSPGESHNSSSPSIPGQSPRYVAAADSLLPPTVSYISGRARMNRKMEAPQYVTSEDLHGNLAPAVGEDTFALPPALNNNNSRRPSSEGESARDHYLYKTAVPHADGLFHCPWEGHPSCNHKPEKLKCNYEYVMIDRPPHIPVNPH